MSWIDRVREYAAEHRYAVLLGVAGLVVVILWLTIGFWRSLLIFAVVGACVFLGRLLDQGGWSAVRAFFDRILPKR